MIVTLILTGCSSSFPAKPLDLSKTGACDTLTKKQVVELGMWDEPASEEGDRETSELCRWNTALDTGQCGLYVTVEHLEGFNDEDFGDQEIEEVWRKTKKQRISGYPVIMSPLGEDDPDTAVVYVSPSQSISIKRCTYDNPESTEKEVTKAARAIITNVS